MFILCKDYIQLYERRRAYLVLSKAFISIINLDKGSKITNACPIVSLIYMLYIYLAYGLLCILRYLLNKGNNTFYSYLPILI